jgi:hypothetical protein
MSAPRGWMAAPKARAGSMRAETTWEAGAIAMEEKLRGMILLSGREELTGELW